MSPSALRRDQIAQTVRSIVSANPILIGVHSQNVLRPIRIVLQAMPSVRQQRVRNASRGINRITREVLVCLLRQQVIELLE